MSNDSKIKFTKIVGFGDSWVYGDELIDPALASANVHFSRRENDQYRETNCFLGQLGDFYGVPVENFGIPGGSLQSAIWTYLWWAAQDSDYANSLVIVWLTESDRHSFIDSTKQRLGKNMLVHSTWVDNSNSSVPLKFVEWVKKFQVLSNCRELARLNYLQTVAFFDGQAAASNLFLMQFNGAPPPVEITSPTLQNSMIDWITFFRLHPGNQNRELIMPDGHPNEKGHQVIAQQLIQEINRAIISK